MGHEDAALIMSDEDWDTHEESADDIIEINAYPEDYELLEDENYVNSQKIPEENQEELNLRKMVIMNNLNEGLIDSSEAYDLIKDFVDEETNNKNGIESSTEQLSATSAPLEDDPSVSRRQLNL